MNLRLLALISVLFLATQCSDDNDGANLEPVIQAYDTLELRYQQIGDLAMELMSNVSVDPQIRMNGVPDMLERQPVVSLDFRKPVTTRKDIITFVEYQKKIDAGVQGIFDQLNGIPKWQEAPLVLDYRSRYESLKDSVGIATRHFNSVAGEAKLNLTIPLDPLRTKLTGH